jgi:MarR family transcriptional regulator, 2-MHQ and catechol-resistance regulon repressor
MKIKDKLNRLNQKDEVIAWKTIMSAHGATYRKLEKNLNEVECGIPRFRILYFLYFEGPLRPMEIAEKSSASRPNITTFLKRMKIDKLVIEQKLKEGKRPKYKLTKKGEKMFEKIFPEHIKKVSSIVKPMPSELLDYLTNLKIRADEVSL